jgi:hypothetical protein
MHFPSHKSISSGFGLIWDLVVFFSNSIIRLIKNYLFSAHYVSGTV